MKNAATKRRQYHHLLDIMLTLLKVCKLPALKSVNRVAQLARLA